LGQKVDYIRPGQKNGRNKRANNNKSQQNYKDTDFVVKLRYFVAKRNFSFGQFAHALFYLTPQDA
jgi:hypothetical protein